MPRVFAFLRSGEFTVENGHQFDPTGYLIPRDIEVDSWEDPSMIKIHLKGSKQTKLGEAWTYYVGKIGNELCPVAAILAYLVVRGQDDARSSA